VKQATVSSFPATAASTASWRRLLLLLVPVRPAGGSVYLCWVSGGGWEDGGSGSILGVVGGFIFFLSIIVGDGTRFGFLRPCERGEILCIHGDVLFVRVAALVTDAGLRVCLPAAVSAAVDCSASSFLCVSAADFRSKSTMRAGESRRWLLRRNHALESFVEEEGGLTLVGVFVAGDRDLKGSPLRWGCGAVNFSSSRVFLVNFHGCTVLPF